MRFSNFCKNAKIGSCVVPTTQEPQKHPDDDLLSRSCCGQNEEGPTSLGRRALTFLAVAGSQPPPPAASRRSLLSARVAPPSSSLATPGGGLHRVGKPSLKPLAQCFGMSTGSD